jgi:hypothetical protein
MVPPAADRDREWKGNEMDKITSQTPALPGDFAAGERTEPVTSAEASRRGDFARGTRTKVVTGQDELEAELHGDYAAGERTEQVTPEEVVPGTFADSDA